MCVCVCGSVVFDEYKDWNYWMRVLTAFEFCSLKKGKLDLSVVVLVGKVQSVDNWFEEEGKINYN